MCLPSYCFICDSSAASLSLVLQQAACGGWLLGRFQQSRSGTFARLRSWARTTAEPTVNRTAISVRFIGSFYRTDLRGPRPVGRAAGIEVSAIWLDNRAIWLAPPSLPSLRRVIRLN